MKLLLALLCLAALPLSAADLTGAWDVQMDIAGMVFKSTFDLKQDGAAITGKAKSEGAEIPIKGSVDGDKIKLEYDTVYNGETYHLTYTGKLDEEGTLKGDVDAVAATGTFTAKRAAAAAN